MASMSLSSTDRRGRARACPGRAGSMGFRMLSISFNLARHKGNSPLNGQLTVRSSRVPFVRSCSEGFKNGVGGYTNRFQLAAKLIRNAEVLVIRICRCRATDSFRDGHNLFKSLPAAILQTHWHTQGVPWVLQRKGRTFRMLLPRRGAEPHRAPKPHVGGGLNEYRPPHCAFQPSIFQRVTLPGRTDLYQ